MDGIERFGEDGEVAPAVARILGKAVNELETEVGCRGIPVFARRFAPVCDRDPGNDLPLRGSGLKCMANTFGRHVFGIHNNGDASVQLAAGEITVDDAVKKVARAASLAAARDTIAEMLDNAAEQAASTAQVQFSRAGENLLAILDKAARDIAKEAKELGPLVAEVSTDGGAMRAGESVRNAWARLGDLAPRLDQIQTLADKLRTYRIVPTERHWDPYEMHYKRPDLLPGIGLEPLPKGTHAVRAFLAQIPALPIEALEGSPRTPAERIELPDHTGEHPDKMPISFDEFPDDYTPFQ